MKKHTLLRIVVALSRKSIDFEVIHHARHATIFIPSYSECHDATFDQHTSTIAVWYDDGKTRLYRHGEKVIVCGSIDDYINIIIDRWKGSKLHRSIID